MKKNKTKRAPIKQWTPALLRRTDRASGRVAMGVIHDQAANGQRRLSMWLARAKDVTP